MKKLFLQLMLVLMVVVLLSFSVVYYRLNEVLKTLDLTEERANSRVSYSFMHGTLDPPINASIVTLAIGKRATVVNQLGDYMKSYLATPAFEKEYREWRSSMEPKSWESMLQAKADEDIKDIDDDLANLEAKPELKKKYEKEIKETKERRAALSDAKHPKRAQYMKEIEADLMEQENKEEIVAEFKKESAELEKKFPAKVPDLIRARLKQFLDESTNIDFDAKLVTRKGKKYFEDPALEEKDGQWKWFFRCGKETITTARTYAQAWLKALPPAGK